MEFLNALPVWALALGIFCLRVIDVSMGTVRTILVVQGRVRLAVMISFFEVLIWVTAVSQVVARVHESPVLLLAFASGFATGNALGIALDRRLAIGTCLVRMIASQRAGEVAEVLRSKGYTPTIFDGTCCDEARSLLLFTCPRRDLPEAVAIVKDIDPRLFYTVDWFSRTVQVGPLPHPTGWRSVFKKK